MLINWYSLDEKKYIEDHRDPSHLVKYLKQGKSFIDSLKLGYLEYVNEDIELYKYEENLKKERIS